MAPIASASLYRNMGANGVSIPCKMLSTGEISKASQSDLIICSTGHQIFLRDLGKVVGFLWRCPQHGIMDWMIVHTFYSGLNPSI